MRKLVAICICTLNTLLVTASELPCEVSWVGNDGGGNRDWVLQDIDDLCVTPEGEIFTHVGWEEGGGNVMRFSQSGAWKDAAMHTHGWGYGGGEAVAASAKYVFIAQHVDNERGGLVGGKGGKGDTLKASFKVVAEVPEGAPQWAWKDVCKVARPAEVSALRRFKVDAGRDIVAFGGDLGADRHQHWKPMGPAVAVYRDALKGGPVKLWSAVLPYSKGSRGHESAEPMSLEIAGDFLFVCYTRGLPEEGVKWAFVKVYGLTDGRFIGNLVPERITGELGLLDLEDSLRVRQLHDGSYVVFLEDDYKAKSVMMRWRPNTKGGS